MYCNSYIRSVCRIHSIRCSSYYLFHHANLCGFYWSAAIVQEWCLLNSVVLVKFFCKCKGFWENVHAPSKALCLQWVKECWEVLPAEIEEFPWTQTGWKMKKSTAQGWWSGCKRQGVNPKRDTATLATATDTELKESDPFTDVLLKY